jgi:hypothetical protein
MLILGMGVSAHAQGTGGRVGAPANCQYASAYRCGTVVSADASGNDLLGLSSGVWLRATNPHALIGRQTGAV